MVHIFFVIKKSIICFLLALISELLQFPSRDYTMSHNCFTIEQSNDFVFMTF